MNNLCECCTLFENNWAVKGLFTFSSEKVLPYFNLNIYKIMHFPFLNKVKFIPVAIRLAMLFSLLMSLLLMSLAMAINFYQAHTLEKQTVHFSFMLAKQTAHLLEIALLEKNTTAINAISQQFVEIDSIANIIVYANNRQVIAQYGILSVSIEKTFIIPIQYKKKSLGYLAWALNKNTLQKKRQKIAHSIIAITILISLIGIGLIFYLCQVLLKPLSNLMLVSKAITAAELNTLASDKGKDEVEILMQAMNEMNKGMLQKDRVEAVFSRYVSAQVAQQVLKDLNNIETVELGGDHLMASVFFADIVGFTSLSERLDAQQISSILNIYFSKIAEVVSFCGGHVDKFIGDCAMVVFGVPVQTRRHGFDCLACAWMILQLINQLNEKREAAGELTVEFRIGANSGMMLAGNMGSSERMEYTVVGDSVNLASRLSGAAEPGELIITEDVFIEQSLEGMIKTQVKDLIKIRGKRLPVNILSVTDILTPFRDKMLAQIPVILAGQKKTMLQKRQPAPVKKQ